MKATPIATVVVLALVTAGSLVFGLQQYRRAERLEQAAAQTQVDHVRLQAKLDRAQSATTATPEMAETVETALAGDAVATPGDGPRVRPTGGGRMSELMEDPEFAAAWQAQQRAHLDGPYAALFRKLNLNPAQIERLKSLLAERQTARMDVMSAARDQGLAGRENRDELRQLMEQAQAEIDGGIRELLGESGYAAYQQYEHTAPQRGLVGQLETRLSYSGSPLSNSQAETLVNILSETAAGPARGDNRTVIAMPGGSPITVGGGTISDAAISRAQGVLAPAQVEALRQLQAEQQAQQQINEMMREHFRREREAARAAPGGRSGG